MRDVMHDHGLALVLQEAGRGRAEPFAPLGIRAPRRGQAPDASLQRTWAICEQDVQQQDLAVHGFRMQLA